jgi:hypothetical protein
MAYSSREVSKMQQEIAPEVYGVLNLDTAPERFRRTIDGPLTGFSRSLSAEKLQKFLEDPQEVELFRQLTLMGDPVADAWAVRAQEMGMGRARAMLDQVLEQGLAAVPDAPAELVALIRDMEKVPEWLNWDRIERYHRRMRAFNALGQEFVMRLAFMMTYTNGYAGLPMLMTGALTGPSAAARMKETTSTFRMSLLPGALRRDGIAFKSAAKVRMMHAMVRTTLLRNKDKWDYETYGVPIPQVDQMGAALFFNFFIALFAIQTKRELSEFELDWIEAWRYLAYLLGMHDYFLANTRRGIITSWSMLGATLRDKVDPRAAELNRTTLKAYTRTGHTWFDKVMHEIDVRNTRFLYSKIVGKELSKKLGVRSHPTDAIATAVLGASIGTIAIGLESLKLLPGGKKRVEAWAIKHMKKMLESAGEAKYATDSSTYAMGTQSAQKRGKRGPDTHTRVA